MATRECIPALERIGVSYEDAGELRRIAMTLASLARIRVRQ